MSRKSRSDLSRPHKNEMPEARSSWLNKNSVDYYVTTCDNSPSSNQRFLINVRRLDMLELANQLDRLHISAAFELRFEAPGMEPKKVPLRAVTDALSALQDLASWRDPFETSKVPAEKGIVLVDVRKGSAVYDCEAQCPEEAQVNFLRVGRYLAEPLGEFQNDDLGTVLSPLKSLSQVARVLGCTISLHMPSCGPNPMFVIDSGIYDRITENAFVTGETTIIGEVMRAGGATDVRCVLRVPGRSKLLYCDVAGEKLARRLGQHLYESIVATGKAQWLNRTWRLLSFEISDFSTPELGDADEAIREIRKAGLSHWDDVADPEELIRGFRL